MNYPLISCIMPTANRRDFVEQSLKLFQAQDYPNKELVILEDGVCSLPLGLSDDTRYNFTEGRLSIGMKRNKGCAKARGEIICHWDDDDYYGPQRLSKQVAPLLSNEADISAMRLSLLFYANHGTLWTRDDTAHEQLYPYLFQQYVHYGTLMYRASYWRNGLRFALVNIGEDVRFVHGMLAQNARMACIVDPASFVYVRHSGNETTDMRNLHREGWQLEATLESYTELPAYMATRKEGENDATTETRKEPGNVTQLDKC